MYKSPIEALIKNIMTDYEGTLMKIVHECGFEVDKDELRKALAYDREQYEKGYAEGTKAMQDEVEILRRRLQHLLQSDYIRSFDEYDPRSHTYKRDIKEADALKKEVHYAMQPALYIQRDRKLDMQLLGHVKCSIFEPGRSEPYTDGCGVTLGFTQVTPPTLTIHLEEVE